MTTSRIFIITLALLGFLAGCADLPEDRGMGDVRRLVAQHTGQVLAPTDTDASGLVAELLAQPLTAQGAAQIALVNNPRLRAEYARLGIAAGEVYNAGRLSNPGFSVSVMASDESSTPNQVTFGLAQSFTDLLLLSSRSRLATAEFERAKQEVGAAVVEFVADTEVAYYELVGAQQVAIMRANVAKAAEVSATLAQRFYDAGNINVLELALEQSAASQAKLEAMRAESAVISARNALNRQMGLRAGDERWATPDQLRPPVANEASFDELIALARVSRLDLLAKRAEVTMLADSLGVTRQFRYVGDVSVGIETERETDRSRLTGPNLAVELPIFNTGAGRVAQAEALVDRAEAEWQMLALEVGNDVHQAHVEVRSARALFEQYRNVLVPLRETVVTLTQQEVSFMLKGQFQLLLVKQQEFDAYQGYLEALRDYWIARTQLARAVGAQLPGGEAPQTGAIAPTLMADAPAPDMQHMNHANHTTTNQGEQP